MYTLRLPFGTPTTVFAKRTATIFRPTGIAPGAGYERATTYAEFAGRVRRVGSVLSAITQPGDRVALWAANSDRYLELFLGIPCSGRVIVPHNTRWAEPEVAFATSDAGARVLVCDRDPGSVAELVDHVIRLDDDGPDGYEALIDRAAEDSWSHPVAPDDLAGLFYTGGTTGRSKGVMLTHANLMANAVQVQLGQPLATDDRYLTIAPMFHAAGVYCAVSALCVGATNVIAGAFDPNDALDIVEGERITCLIAVPTMLAAMNEAQMETPRDVSSLRWLSHGASPVALEVLRRAAELFDCELIHLYGATETAPIATIMRNEQHLLDTERSKSAGIAAPGVKIRIAQPDPSGVGEVEINGPNVMVGYWNQPELTAAALTNDGWYRSGDVGRLDDDGYLFLVDRAKDMIVSGGENIYCTEVEDALYTHDAVLEATVFGIPDDRWGERVHAVVVARDGMTASEEELIDHCRGMIASYKLPKSIEFSPHPLPKSGPGKVLKRELRAPYWEGHERAIN